MKDQMKYLVIEGRAPQNGSAAKRALILCPKWMSSTLVCAGIVGRVIELTDGNIIEEGNVPMSEQECLEGLRLDAAADLESQQEEAPDFAESRAEGMEPPANQSTPGYALAPGDFAESRAEGMEPAQTPADAAQQHDEAYRQGMQANLNAMLGELSRLGMPPNTRPLVWIQGLIDELEQLRNPPQPVADATLDGFNSDKNVQELRRLCIANGYDPVEMGALLPWLEAQLVRLELANNNLDAWRDAAGAAGLAQECDAITGQIKRLYVGASADPQVDMDLNTLCGAYGCLPGQDRLSWVQTQLNALIEVSADKAEREREHIARVDELHSHLDKIRKLAKNALK